MTMRSGVSSVHLEEDVRVTLADASGTPYGPANPLPVSGLAGGNNNVQVVAQSADLALGSKQDAQTAQLQALNSLVPSVYDFIGLEYTGSDLTKVRYRLGGAAGALVSTLDLAYSGGNLSTVTKS